MEGCFLMIHFILDSTSGVSKDILDKYPQIHKVPLYMFVDGEYRDESEFTIDDVIEYSEREKKAIQTSQPSKWNLQRRSFGGTSIRPQKNSCNKFQEYGNRYDSFT